MYLWFLSCLFLPISWAKGSLTRALWLQAFFIYQLSLGPWVSRSGNFEYLRKFAENLKVKVDHRCCWHMINRKIIFETRRFSLLICCWVAVYIHIMIFYFWFILRCRQADGFATVSAQASIIAGFVTGNTLSLVLLLPVICISWKCYWVTYASFDLS